MSDLANAIQRGEADRKSIDELLLDDRNPRFGELDRKIEQSQIVDLIIEKFGIEDILSSMASLLRSLWFALEKQTGSSWLRRETGACARASS